MHITYLQGLLVKLISFFALIPIFACDIEQIGLSTCYRTIQLRSPAAQAIVNNRLNSLFIAATLT